MINLRYHIVSLTAVFLALAIGVAMGSSFLDKAAVDQIKKNLSSAERRIDRTRAENAQLKGTLDRLAAQQRQLGEQGAKRLFDDSLPGVPVLIVATAGADGSSLDQLAVALEASAAQFQGVLTLNRKLSLTGDGDAGALAQVLGSTSSQPGPLRSELVSVLGRGMRAAAATGSGGGPSGTTTTTAAGAPPGTGPAATTAPETTTTIADPSPAATEANTVVQSLIDAGFLNYSPPQGGGQPDGLLLGAGQRFVFVSGANADLLDDAFLLPLLRTLAKGSGVPGVLASAATGDQPEEVRGAVVGPVLGDGTLRNSLSTVDDLESFSGIAAVVLALEDVAAGRYGHYGVGKGAKALLPPPPSD